MGLLAILLLAGCRAGGPFPLGRETPAPDLDRGVALVESPEVISFYERASFFYGRLARRRFNSLATYRDEVLRDFFRSEEAYADYYADLASRLYEAHFERSRPTSLEVLEFALEGPGKASVTTRIVGRNGLPLRFWKVELDRVDRWERIDGTWWVVPGKL